MQSDKVIILTGGSSGIGRSAALRFARQGHKVLVTGRHAGPLEEAVAEHPNLVGLVADAASARDASRTVANAVAAGPTESGALTGMMRLTSEQAAAVKEQERARIPLGRRGIPEDVADWIVRLAGSAADWTTGQVIAIDGGLGLT